MCVIKWYTNIKLIQQVNKMGLAFFQREREQRKQKAVQKSAQKPEVEEVKAQEVKTKTKRSKA